MIESLFAACLLSLCFGCPLWLTALADTRKRLRILALIGVQAILLAICGHYLSPKSYKRLFAPISHTEKLTTI